MFIKLTTPSGAMFLANMAMVKEVGVNWQPEFNHKSILYYGDGETTKVMETREEIYEQMVHLRYTLPPQERTEVLS